MAGIKRLLSYGWDTLLRKEGLQRSYISQKQRNLNFHNFNCCLKTVKIFLQQIHIAIFSAFAGARLRCTNLMQPDQNIIFKITELNFLFSITICIKKLQRKNIITNHSTTGDRNSLKQATNVATHVI